MSPRRRLLVSILWIACLAVPLALAFHARRIDDGDPSIVFRFHSWLDLAFVLGTVAAVTLEVRRAVFAGVSWRRTRTGREIEITINGSGPGDVEAAFRRALDRCSAGPEAGR
ncbi:MAG TPA: hypothetical protein VLT47_14245 [Anaeromyxobacteraceae bacterium]|nr:hypothetical protein [Anaeromyxobacteraceae bacterium]